MKYQNFKQEKHFNGVSIYNGDCMELLKQTPDKYYDLAIIDPPYGIGANKMTLGNRKTKLYRGKADWDATPTSVEYFDELFRVSKNQIIWGANHFISRMPIDSSCWIFWDKGTGKNDFADGELAWTSFNMTVRKFFKSWVGANAKEKNEHDRIHPTQKPVALYEWLLKNYSEPNQKILDTHLGSGSIAIAIDKANKLDKKNLFFVGIELDNEYYQDAISRIDYHARQQTIF